MWDTLDKAAAWLKEKLDFEFSDQGLMQQALTHRSAPGNNNERLEFLGDAVLQLTISEVVFRARANATEGQLSRLRSSLVKDSMLAKVATDLELGKFIILGPGERKSGGHRRASILADALEAIFGAAFLDQGIEAASRVIYKAYGERLENIPEAAELRDPKTRLQEWLQSRAMQLPEYRLDRTSGKAHRQTFEVSCIVADAGLTTHGSGATRREAEQKAARAMFEQLAE